MSGGRCARVAAAVLAVALVGCADFPGRPRPEDRPVRADQVRDASALYATHCAGCHGRDGRYGAARPLDDPLYLAWVDDATLTRVIARGVPGTAMPAFAVAQGGTLRPDQIDALVAGLRSRWAKPIEIGEAALPPYAATLGDASRGAATYTRYCASCHGAKGEGGKVRGSIVDGAYLSLVSDQALRSIVVVGRHDLGMPDWRNALPGQPMGDGEIADVVAWLAAQRVSFPGRPSAAAVPHPRENVDG